MSYSDSCQYGSPYYGSPYYGSPYYGSPYYGSPYYGSPYYGSPYYGSPILRQLLVPGLYWLTLVYTRCSSQVNFWLQFACSVA